MPNVQCLSINKDKQRKHILYTFLHRAWADGMPWGANCTDRRRKYANVLPQLRFGRHCVCISERFAHIARAFVKNKI